MLACGLIADLLADKLLCLFAFLRLQLIVCNIIHSMYQVITLCCVRAFAGKRRGEKRGRED